MTQALATRQQDTSQLATIQAKTLTESFQEVRQSFIDTYMPGASEAEMLAFYIASKRTGLRWETREIYAVPREDNGVKRWTYQTGIDGYRKIAESTGLYEGQLPPEWCGSDGEWKTVWIEDTPPVAARVGILRKGWKQPTYHPVRYKEYVARNKYGITRMWEKMPCNQLAKCAEAGALRKAFPATFEGIYTEEEMQQADNEPPAPKNDSGFSTPDKQPEAKALPPSFPGKVPTSLPELTQLLKAWREREEYEGESKAFINTVIQKAVGVAMPLTSLDAKQREVLFAFVHDAAKSGESMEAMAKPWETEQPPSPPIEATPEPSPEPKAEAKPKTKSSTITPDDIPF